MANASRQAGEKQRASEQDHDGNAQRQIKQKNTATPGQRKASTRAHP
jgi:hypothetical protein